jgi:hypothetical protein
LNAKLRSFACVPQQFFNGGVATPPQFIKRRRQRLFEYGL